MENHPNNVIASLRFAIAFLQSHDFDVSLFSRAVSDIQQQARQRIVNQHIEERNAITDSRSRNL